MTDCIFCKIVKREIPADIIYEDDHVLAFLDIRPVNNGHTLIIPKTHFVDLLETPDAIASDLIRHTKSVARAVMRSMKADGFNLGVNTKGAAGQVVFHTHFHIIPRFSKDGLRHWPHKELPSNAMKDVAQAIRNELK